MLKFLLNANLSVLTKEFLQEKFNYDVKITQDFGMNTASDEEIIELAKKEKRIIITLDLDFGEIYYFYTPRDLGVIVLRLKIQTVEEVNRILERFF